MNSSPDVTAFILAGGKSTRMGRDKAFLEYQGQTLLARVIALAHSITADVRIVGSRDKFAAFAPVLEDIFPDCGPLGGIHAALKSASTELSLILAVDTPFLAAAFLRYLIDQARGAPEATVIVPRVSGGWQPLCAVYRREFAVGAEKALRAGRYRIDSLFDLARTRVIETTELKDTGFSESIFGNLNAPEDLQALKPGG
jgi:molybdenum cofactor guanylyltransferase